MTVKIAGISATLANLQRIAAATSRAERALVEEYAEKIAAKARDYAPVDEGYLEGAIEVDRSERSGINGRIVHKIGVNTSKLGPGYSQRGYPYHIAMHEDPNDESGNGPRSQEKANRLGVMVGPKYLSRALADYKAEMKAAAKALAKKEARK